MLKLLPKELKAIGKIRGIKGYKSISEDRILSDLKALESLKESEKNFDDTKSKIKFSKPRTEKIRKEFNELRHKFSKSQINEIRRNLYEIENKKKLFALKKEIERNLLELVENLFRPKKYYDYDDTEYKGIRDVKDLFDLSIDEDYYKPIITNSASNNNYIQYESKGYKDKILTTSEYLDMMRPSLIDIINDHKTQGEWKIRSGNAIKEHKTQGEWKIHLTMETNFISSKDSDETRAIHAESDNAEMMMGSKTNEIIENLFKSFLQRYQEGFEESMRGSEFIFDSVEALYYDLSKISLSTGGSYIDSPKGLKNKKAAINPKTNNNKCFQYALTVTLNYEQIALNILYVPHNTEKIRHAFKLKYNSESEIMIKSV